VRHAFDGTLELARSLADLATVFDMTGFSLSASRERVDSSEPGLALESRAVSRGVYAISGSVDDQLLDPHDVLSRLAMALDADGIRFALRLRDARGDVLVTYESDH